MPGAVLTDTDRTERYEAFIGVKQPYRSLAGGSIADMRTLIRDNGTTLAAVER